MTRCLNVELLLSRRVFDQSGSVIGRVQDFECEGDEVMYVLAGKEALLERLWGLHRLTRVSAGYRIRWDQLDWDSESLTLLCDVAEVHRIR
jgi:hypothetical protein